MNFQRMSTFVLVGSLIVMTGCGPNSFGIAMKKPGELRVTSDADLCYAQRYWRSPNLMNEIARRKLDCNTAVTPSIKEASSPTGSVQHAQSLFSYTPSSVWQPPDNEYLSQWHACRSDDCLIAIMKKMGATGEAIDFARQLKFHGFLSDFQEKGHVDLGSIFFPTRANSNLAYVLLNGTPSLVSTEEIKVIDISRDPNYETLKNKYPKLGAWTSDASFISMVKTSDGGQRFVFSYYLVNECHACGIGWNATIAFDFGENGAFSGTKVLNVVEDKTVSHRQTPAPSPTAVKTAQAQKQVICGKTTFKNLTTNQGKALKFLLEGSDGRYKGDSCITDLEAVDKFPLRGQTVIKYKATVVFPNGYRTECLQQKDFETGGFDAVFGNLNCTDLVTKPATIGEIRIYTGQEII